MAITTLSSREFNQDKARAKRAAQHGPVFVTERGKPSLVLLSYGDYRRLGDRGKLVADLLDSPETANLDDADWLELRAAKSSLQEPDFG